MERPRASSRSEEGLHPLAKVTNLHHYDLPESARTGAQ